MGGLGEWLFGKHCLAGSRSARIASRGWNGSALLTLNTAHLKVTAGNKSARGEIAMLTVVAEGCAPIMIERPGTLPRRGER